MRNILIIVVTLQWAGGQGCWHTLSGCMHWQVRPFAFQDGEAVAVIETLAEGYETILVALEGEFGWMECSMENWIRLPRLRGNASCPLRCPAQNGPDLMLVFQRIFHLGSREIGYEEEAVFD